MFLSFQLFFFFCGKFLQEKLITLNELTLIQIYLQ